MNNNVLGNSSHLKSAVAVIKSAPFISILSERDIKKEIEKIDYRPRYNYYPPEITLWLLLSQVLGNEMQDKAVSRLIARDASKQMEENEEMEKFTFLRHPIKFMGGTTVSMPDTAQPFPISTSKPVLHDF